jgi:flagellar biogenesis protein FliO
MTGPQTHEETSMYIGGGILGTILLIVLIVYFVRRI